MNGRRSDLKSDIYASTSYTRTISQTTKSKPQRGGIFIKNPLHSISIKLSVNGHRFKDVGLMGKYLAFTILILCIGCSKNLDEPHGDFRIDVSVRHHTLAVPYTEVFLAYDTKNFPGKDTSVYDLFFIADGKGKILMKNLFPGNHYIYGRGYDGDSLFGNRPIYIDPLDPDRYSHIIFQISE